MAKRTYTPPNPYETRGFKRKAKYKKLVDIVETHAEKARKTVNGFPLIFSVPLERLAGTGENCKRYVNAVRQARDFMDMKARLKDNGLSITVYNHETKVTIRVRKIEE